MGMVIAQCNYMYMYWFAFPKGFFEPSGRLFLLEMGRETTRGWIRLMQSKSRHEPRMTMEWYHASTRDGAQVFDLPTGGVLVFCSLCSILIFLYSYIPIPRAL